MITRRIFLKLAGMAVTVLPVHRPKLVFSKGTELRINIVKVKKLKRVGGWVILKIKGKLFLFVRDGKESVKVFNPYCTHRRCIVGYNNTSKKIKCKCHGSVFDMSGQVVRGPARKPLPMFKSKLDGDHLVINLE